MQFFANSKIPFMKFRKVFVWVSITLLTVAVVELIVLGGLNFGIDFSGGTQLTVKLQDDGPALDDIRNSLNAAGIEGATLQQYGAIEEHEILIKTPVKEVADTDSEDAEDAVEEGTAADVIAALNAELNQGNDGKIDLNQRGRDTLSTLLLGADPDGKSADADEARAHYEAVADAIVSKRQELKIFASMDEALAVEGVSEASADLIRSSAFVGAFQVLANENVGPQIGSELRTKGYLAVIMSLLGMLAYIWFRFELRFGIGALVAVFHDFLITLGLYALLDFEFNLPTIAAFLTLVGYSVNDTVVIFDRVRENMRRFRRKPMEEVMDLSINQTLSRTILTSGTTLLVVASLFFAGGEVLRGFAFVLMIGVIVGTYSSIFVASPFTLLWEQWRSAKAEEKQARAMQA